MNHTRSAARWESLEPLEAPQGTSDPPPPPPCCPPETGTTGPWALSPSLPYTYDVFVSSPWSPCHQGHCEMTLVVVTSGVWLVACQAHHHLGLGAALTWPQTHGTETLFRPPHPENSQALPHFWALTASMGGGKPAACVCGSWPSWDPQKPWVPSVSVLSPGLGLGPGVLQSPRATWRLLSPPRGHSTPSTC